MSRINIDSFLSNTSIEDYKVKDKTGKIVSWKEYLISLINDVIPDEVDNCYDEMTDALLGALNSRNIVLNANNSVEKSFEKNIENKELYNNKTNEREFIENEIRSICKKISDIDNIQNSTELFKQLKQLYKALEKIEEAVKVNSVNLSKSNKQYNDSETNFVLFQKLYIKQLSYLLNKIKKVEDLKITEENIKYDYNKKKEFQKLIDLLPLDNERKTMLISLIDQYIESKILTIKYLNELSREIVSDPNIIATGEIIDNENYQKVLLGEAIEDAFYVGNGGLSIICSGDIYKNENGNSTMGPLSESAFKRVSDTILSMDLANQVLNNLDVELENLDEMYTNTTDPMIYTMLVSMRDINDKKLKRRV